MKEFRKSVSIWQSYGQTCSGKFDSGQLFGFFAPSCIRISNAIKFVSILNINRSNAMCLLDSGILAMKN